MNRKISFKALVGSHNYNLQIESSDKDYKAFFLPSFEDLYSGEKYSKSIISDIEDIEYHDIRKLPDMLWKSNVNFLEVLFSMEVHRYDELYDKLHSKREEIARMNLPYLYDACMGMFNKKYKEFKRNIFYGGSINDLKPMDNQPEKVYKHAMSALRILDFLERYKDFNYNFQLAIRYTHEAQRDNLLSVRKGKYSFNELDEMMQLTEQYTIEKLKDWYKGHKPNEEMKQWVEYVVREHVKENIKRELTCLE
jgi:predicted nucleotidyltransferase